MKTSFFDVKKTDDYRQSLFSIKSVIQKNYNKIAFEISLNQFDVLVSKEKERQREKLKAKYPSENIEF